ncbi:MAG TPA: ABC transporter permease [Pseudonocardiaceae bacterium]|jgi:ABC-2 type transport system permease protein|nr:ABC transporter permease [Pseudonocardiaceae bacterium]
MSTLSYAVSDSVTLLRRNLKHALRYPALTMSTVGMPVIFLLLFVYVFGNTLGAGIGSGTSYINYLAPGIILMVATSGAVSTAISVCMDMTEGIVDRFRTMSISRAALLTGHVLGSVIQGLLSMGVVLGIAVAIGFRPEANLLQWLGAIGVLAMLCLALTWLSVAMGLVSKSPENASNLPLPLILLPFLGSGFVPAASMSPGLRQFAEYQPFTPMTQTLRGLLLGTHIGNEWILAVVWCVVLSALGYLASRRLLNRLSNR